jgi:hypothetical protein
LIGVHPACLRPLKMGGSLIADSREGNYTLRVGGLISFVCFPAGRTSDAARFGGCFRLARLPSHLGS